MSDQGSEGEPATEPRRYGLAEVMEHARKLATQGGDSEGADKILQEVVAQVPGFPDAWNFRGIIAAHGGRYDEAEGFIRRAIELAPEYADAHSNLGNLLLKQKRHDEAVGCYQRAVALRPELVSAHHNLGNAYKAQNRYPEAIASYKRAVELAPERGPSHFSLAQAYTDLGLTEQALEGYKASLRLSPGETSIYAQLGSVLVACGQLDNAAKMYRAWVTVDPDNATARHMLAACTGEAVEGRASDGYVRETFDLFADCFDRVLSNLQYRAPALVSEGVAALLGQPAGNLDVVDAGCGTGLCGESLRPYARRLVGVDLSGGMLEKALARKLYDQLHHHELVAFLNGAPGAYDLVVSADTLVYFGKLDAAMAAAATALRPGGHLVFTVERAEEAEAPEGFRLHPHGRYSQSEPYLRSVLTAAGLHPRSLTRCVLRNENSKPVEGLLVVAAR
jgi:predicted TPR repeat methyltransferase